MLVSLAKSDRRTANIETIDEHFVVIEQDVSFQIQVGYPKSSTGCKILPCLVQKPRYIQSCGIPHLEASDAASTVRVRGTTTIKRRSFLFENDPFLIIQKLPNRRFLYQQCAAEFAFDLSIEIDGLAMILREPMGDRQPTTGDGGYQSGCNSGSGRRFTPINQHYTATGKMQRPCQARSGEPLANNQNIAAQHTTPVPVKLI